MKKIKEVLEGVYINPSLRKKVVPLFIGNPGLGKTKLIEQFAEEKGVKLVEMITSQMSPFEISGIAFPDKDTKMMSYYNLDKLDSLEDGDILFFDEVLNGNPAVLNACLTVLEQRRFISGKPLPDIMIVAAANPQGMVPILPQIKERFLWYKVNFSSEMFKDYLFNKYKIPESVSIQFCSLIQGESFEGENFFTPRSVDKNIEMVLNNVPTPYSKVFEPILNTLIKNELGDVTNEEGKTIIFKGEKIKWLDLYKLSKNGSTEK